ncbi:MAG: efflux RND transporter periplasmic adaptor subunit [Bacillota bacterium]|nr:efflux RND transporter periplasmic adaptor subunit [Bacillota bacterium]
MQTRIGVLAVVLLLLCAGGCAPGQEAASNDMRPTVTVEKVKKQEISVKKVYDVVMELDEEQYICAQMPGYVRHFYHQAGDKVMNGDTLVLIENQTTSLAMESADQEVALAQLQYEKVKESHQKDQGTIAKQQLLFEEGAISQDALQQMELDLALLANDMNQTQLRLDQALVRQEESRLNIDNAALKADDTLWLAENMVQIGQYVNAGQMVFRAGKRDHLVMDLAVPREEMNGWQEGDSLQVEYRGEVRLAMIENINTVSQPGTERIVIKIRVDNPELDWSPGSFAEVKFLLESDAKVLVPIEAIGGGEDPYVYVIKDQKAYRQKVALGAAEGSRVVVSGVDEGSLVVTGGLHRLRDGEAVIVKEGL